MYLLKGTRTDSNLAGNIFYFFFLLTFLSTKYESPDNQWGTLLQTYVFVI